MKKKRLVVRPPIPDFDHEWFAAIGTRGLHPSIAVQRGADAESVPRTVAVPPAVGGTNAVGSRGDGERVEHSQLVRRVVENEGVLGSEAAPAGKDVTRISQLRRDRRATVLDEERVRPAAQLEVGLVHSRDAIPSLG